MKVKAVVVDELPKDCLNCVCKVTLLGDVNKGGLYRKCKPMDKVLDEPTIIPDWCPLVLENANNE